MVTRSKRFGTPAALQPLDVAPGRWVIKTMRPDMVIVRYGPNNEATLTGVSADQTAKHLVWKIGRALGQPGVDRQAVFKSKSAVGNVVYAYSLDPKDPSRFIREDQKGEKTVGSMVRGTFSPSPHPRSRSIRARG